jgi:GAF domain-containing protein
MTVSYDQVGPAVARHPLSTELLKSVVDVARAFFGAQASSVFLFDDEAHELVFQCVSGRGEDVLVGRRFPAASGIAGWVVATGEPIVVDDLSRNATFDRGFAESTSYIPNSMMAAPLIHRDRILGVIEVLDPAPQSRSSLNELDLLSLFAVQAAIALRIVVDRTRSAPDLPPPPTDDRGRVAALALIEDLQRLLGTTAA